MYYVFNGQNASTGVPNEITGNMSYYGDVLKFNSKKEALEYVEDKSGFSAQELIVAGTKRTMRKYCLGMTVADFELWLEHDPVLVKDEDGRWVEEE